MPDTKPFAAHGAESPVPESDWYPVYQVKDQILPISGCHVPY